MKKWMKIWKLFKLLKILIFYWKEFGKQLKIKQNSKKKKGFLGMLLGTLGAVC